MRFVRRAWVGLLVLLVPAVQAGPLKLPALSPPAKARHGDPATPTGWRRLTGDAAAVRAWRTDGRGGALWLAPGASLGATLATSALDPREAKVETGWVRVVSVDLLGRPAGPGDARLVLSAHTPGVAKALARREGRLDREAGVWGGRGWTAVANRADRRHPAAAAVDGDPSTGWIAAVRDQPPSLTIDLGRAVPVHGLRYVPRVAGGDRGVVVDYRLSLSADGTRWQPAAAGQLSYAGHARAAQTIRLAEPVIARHVRFEALSDLLGKRAAAAAELTPLLAAVDAPPRAAARRVWLVVPGAAGPLELRVTAAGAGAVVGRVLACRVTTAPTRALLGKANGHLGPDRLAAGGLGFDALTEHGQRVLTVLAVRAEGPAAAAGLRPGDLIVAVNGRPLPVNDIAPGWLWYERSHEAVLGRAALDGLRDPGRAPSVALTVLRDGAPQTLRVKAPRVTLKGALTDLDGPLYRDLLAFVVRTQRKDGSWGKHLIRTTLSTLALLATRDTRHAGRIRAAIDWLLRTHPEPTAYGNLGYWSAGYAGILYAEYYLASGDRRVLSRIRAGLDWALSGVHTSKWGTPCLGHGPGGLPYGQKSLVAPTVHLLVAEALAARCGVRSRLSETVLPFVMSAWSDPATGGHGALGYNASYRDQGEFWSRSGLFGLALALTEGHPRVQAGIAACMDRRHPWFRNSHAYGEPGGALGLLALARLDPAAHARVLDAYAWWFALAWQPGHGLRFTTPHMGAPYMGTDDLITPAYALVLAASRKTLAMTGADSRRWLRPARRSTGGGRVLIRRDAKGRVALRTAVPGARIRYTLDGREPDGASALYVRPFALPAGGEVVARPLDARGKPGPVTRGELGPPKLGWRILEATGHRDPGTARARAARAIDEDPALAWRTDVGQGAPGFPHRLTVDLGRSLPVAALRLTFADGKQAIKAYRVELSKDGATWQTAAEGTLPAYQVQTVIALPRARRARQLRLIAITGTGKGPGLVLAELDVRLAR